MQGEARVSPVLISSHKISKKPYVQSLQKKLGVNQFFKCKHNLELIRKERFCPKMRKELKSIDFSYFYKILDKNRMSMYHVII